MAELPYQSLYRRYRPQRFSEVRGQDHVTRALRNSVRQGTVSHAYLFSGPRGTGKTSTARILAKALNCAAPVDGEPCGECESCLAVTAGTSLDVHELDAASNNGVDAMRDLVARAALGTPGRWKVYIVDEVHMLSAAASNALLKTLEEPPGHVVFVLATTDPHKVLDTIKSRTQHFEFRLLAGEMLSVLLKDVSADAGLGLPGGAIDLAVRRGHGSARDALSFLDQVAAAGVVEDEAETLDDLIEAMVEGDVPGLLTAVATACAAGLDPQRLGGELLAQLRFAFLATMAPDLVPLPDAARERAAEQAVRLGTPAVVRAMETIGRALADMNEALDPRILLEVALIGLVKSDEAVGGGARPGPRPTADGAAAGAGARADEAVLARLEQIERRLDALEAGGADARSRGRATLGAVRAGAPPAQTGPAPADSGQPSAGPEPGPTGATPATGRGLPPSRDDLVKAWGDGLLSSLPARARARFRTGRFAQVREDGVAVFAVPNEPHRRMSEECRRDVEDALERHFGVRVPIRLVVEADPAEAGGGSAAAAAPPPADDDVVDITELADAPAAPAARPEDRLLEAFPGAEEVER
ncbi:MAG TPA: DNA polymerase III subunit gamma/tau [Acidimicrobiales bacterium]|nr:DNA polymerase III subunit gamma/tau [Acidimicrobiales bacterium]